MNLQNLPMGNRPTPIAFPHFPTLWQAVIWRNWEIVTPERISKVLKCSVDEIVYAADAMGLNTKPNVNSNWLSRGYLTIIRNNWHLLSYSQLLQLLGWSPDKMAYTLKEEDFFWVKMGKLKPECPEVLYSPLSELQEKETKCLKQTLQTFFRKDELSYCDQPFAFLDRFASIKKTIGSPKFEVNFIHSYSASCGDVLGNADMEEPVPEKLLSQYGSMGIKGIWLHALLYLLFPIPGAEEYSAGCERRMANLKRIIAVCKKYGLKVYLYLNEPRCMPLSFYEKKPLWAGYDVPSNNTKTVCTTRSSEPLLWLENSMKRLFTEAKGLGGVFCITMSENPTNCNYARQCEKCPSCAKVIPSEIVANVIKAMERGMHAADPEADMIAYDWSWGTMEDTNESNLRFKQKVIDLLPKSVFIQSVSEWGKITHVGGVEQYLEDYSISQVGPSEESLSVWKHALKHGNRTIAKVQINNSWELSAIPYIPVPYLIQEHLDNLKKAGVSGLMLSWTLGGFPGGNLELLNASPEEIALAKYHPVLASKVCDAWKIFSNSFREFPFHGRVLYTAPMNFGPMNLLHLHPTGYQATMIGFPYDDLKTWRSVYPEDVFENQFKKITDGWRKGLEILSQAKALVRPDEFTDFNELCVIAEAGYCHLYSTYQQIRFIRARDNGFDREIMTRCVEEELKTVRRLYDLVRQDSRLGFEASNHYYYSLNDLREKVVSCVFILQKLNHS